MKFGLGLAYRKDGDGIHVFGSSLGVGVKVAHGIQLVTEEFGADGHVGGRGVDIQNAASDRELTGAFYHAAAAIAGCGQFFY